MLYQLRQSYNSSQPQLFNMPKMCQNLKATQLPLKKNHPQRLAKWMGCVLRSLQLSKMLNHCWLVVSTSLKLYWSNWESSANRGENKKYLKSPPRLDNDCTLPTKFMRSHCYKQYSAKINMSPEKGPFQKDSISPSNIHCSGANCQFSREEQVT